MGVEGDVGCEEGGVQDMGDGLEGSFVDKLVNRGVLILIGRFDPDLDDERRGCRLARRAAAEIGMIE